MRISHKMKRILLSLMAVLILACGAVTTAVLIGVHSRSDEGRSMIPKHLSIPSSINSSVPQKEEWPKVPIPERDPNYQPVRPDWLTADLTEIDPVPGKVAYLTF